MVDTFAISGVQTDRQTDRPTDRQTHEGLFISVLINVLQPSAASPNAEFCF
jgi:hypothetical protein